MNDVPIGFFITYINPKYDVPQDDNFYYDSLYKLLREKHNISIDKVTQSITAELADKTTLDALNMAKGEAVMVMKRKAYSKGELVEYSVCKYDGKRYEYKMEVSHE